MFFLNLLLLLLQQVGNETRDILKNRHFVGGKRVTGDGKLIKIG